MHINRYGKRVSERLPSRIPKIYCKEYVLTQFLLPTSLSYVILQQPPNHINKTKINQETYEPKDLIRGCVMPAPIGFRVAMLGGIFLCYLDVGIGVCVLDNVIHGPRREIQLEKVQRTHH